MIQEMTDTEARLCEEIESLRADLDKAHEALSIWRGNEIQALNLWDAEHPLQKDEWPDGQDLIGWLLKEVQRNKESLRDKFAKAAMQGDWAAQSQENTGVFHTQMSDESFQEQARMYFRMADEMMKVRDDQNLKTHAI